MVSPYQPVKASFLVLTGKTAWFPEAYFNLSLMMFDTIFQQVLQASSDSTFPYLLHRRGYDDPGYSSSSQGGSPRRSHPGGGGGGGYHHRARAAPGSPMPTRGPPARRGGGHEGGHHQESEQEQQHRKWKVQTATRVHVVVRVRPMSIREIKEDAKVNKTSHLRFESAVYKIL